MSNGKPGEDRNGGNVSLRDVAAEATCSVATASMALRDDHRIAAKTRERVRAAARRLGYRPNALLSQLGARRFRQGAQRVTQSIAILTGDESWERFTRILQELASDAGYQSEHHLLRADSDVRPLARVLYHRGVAGVIVGQMLAETRFLEANWDAFAIIGSGQLAVSLSERLHWVRPDFYWELYRSVEEAIRRGYRRLLVALPEEAELLEDNEMRRAALFTLDRRFGEQVAIHPWFYQTHPDRFAAQHGARFLELVASYRPDVVLAHTLGSYYTLKNAGYQIPEDLGFACLHIQTKDPWYEGIEGLPQHQELLARSTIEVLNRLIVSSATGFPASPLRIGVKGNWVPGKTLPAKSASPHGA